ncbi:MAG: hypothetical protein ACE5HN_01015 [Nitrospiria bacterium]
MPLYGWMISIIIIITIALLLIPFRFTIDSGQKSIHLRWHLLEAAVDFSKRTILIGFAGIRYRKKMREASPTFDRPDKKQKKGTPKRPPLLRVLLSRRSLLMDLVPKVVRYLIRLLRLASVREIRWDYGSTDPIINGICYGLVQGIRIKNVRISVNFFGENHFVGRFSLQLYRIMIPTLCLLAQLPYARLYRLYKETREGAGGLARTEGT